MAEACLLYKGWTPETCLQMRATLFFAMVNHGKVLARRERMRHYAEQCKITAYPTYIDEHKQELLQYYFDSSMSPHDWAERERIRREMETRAAKNYATTHQALEFFRGSSGGAR